MPEELTRYRLLTDRLHGRALDGNALGDPVDRDLHLLVPDGHDPARPTPLVVVLASYAGTASGLLVDEPWSEGLQRRVERLAREGRVGPMIYALPDCWTRYGGSQYLDSDATGRYEHYLWHDVVDGIRARLAVSQVALVGRSSGGYGALVQAMRHPDRVAAVACHSGDMAFEYCYQPELPKLVRALRRHGGLDAFLARFDEAVRKRDGQWFDAINLIAMASCYSPDGTKPRGIAFPCDLETGALVDEVWARWLAWDPLRMIEQPAYARALAGLRLLFLDAGSRDEYFFDLGARRLSRRLGELGIAHLHEEYDDGHRGTQYRLDVSLARIWDALRSDQAA